MDSLSLALAVEDEAERSVVRENQGCGGHRWTPESCARVPLPCRVCESTAELLQNSVHWPARAFVFNAIQIIVCYGTSRGFEKLTVGARM